MSGNKIPETTQVQVRWQSQGLCEYCHAAEQWQYVRFTVDHVVPLSKGGVDTVGSLILTAERD
jgi:5-methylcytosine-specific restriction endonuclease McrA